MPIEWTTVIEGGIPILGGLYATALEYGAVSRFAASAESARTKNSESISLARPPRLFVWMLCCLAGTLTGNVSSGRADCPSDQEPNEISHNTGRHHTVSGGRG